MRVVLGICVAYDWQLLALSIPGIYAHVDAICLSVDQDLTSWNGNPFTFDEAAFNVLVQQLDPEGKIAVLRESFYSPLRTPIDNECYQRKRMADYLGKSDWIVQIDTDEIFVDFNVFKKLLYKYRNVQRPVSIHGQWINLVKQTAAGFVYTVSKTPPLATNKPAYDYGRTNGHFNVYTDSFLLHQTWARPEAEVYYKLNNWGHSHEFDGLSFFNIWKALDDFNWRYVKDFHPGPSVPLLQVYYCKASTLEALLQMIDLRQHRLPWPVRAANNIWVSRVQKVWRLKGVFWKEN